LTALGFLKLVRRVPRRGAVEHYYTAAIRPPLSDDAWGATPAVVKQANLSAALTQIGSDVSAAAAGGGFELPEARVSRLAMVLDEQGLLELAQELEQSAARISKIEAESRDRLAQNGGERHATAVVQLLFEPRPTTS
jgi:hypothetical protein